jgi:hypothetical protein
LKHPTNFDESQETPIKKSERWAERKREQAEKQWEKVEKLERNAEDLFNNDESRTYLIGPYLDHLRENLRDIGSAYGRSFTFVLLVIAAFELFARAAVDKASLGPFEVTELSLIQKALPVIGSYFFYDLAVIGIRGAQVNNVYGRILRLLHPEFHRAGLLILIPPHRSSLVPQRMPGQRTNGLYERLSSALYYLVIFGIPCWDVYAFIILFGNFHISDVTLWIAFVISVLYIILGISVLRFPHKADVNASQERK